MRLILHFNHHPPTAVAYTVYEGNLIQKHGEASVDEIPTLVEEQGCREVRFIIPGERVSSFSVELPKGARKQLDSALPYVVEEHVVTPIEDMHLAYEVTDGIALVLAAGKDTLVNYLTLAEKLPCTLTGIFPDYLGLPQRPTPQSANLDERRILRYGDGTAFVFAGGSEGPTPLDDAADSTADSVSLETLQNGWRELSASSSLNLLPNDLRRNQTKRLPKALAAGILISASLFIAYFLAAGVYFHQKASAEFDEARALYQELFPADKRIVSIRKQMRGHLANLKQGSDDQYLFQMLSSLSKSIGQGPGSSLHLQHFRFDNSDRSLVAEIQANSFQDGTLLTEALRQENIATNISSAIKNDAGVLLKVTLELP